MICWSIDDRLRRHPDTEYTIASWARSCAFKTRDGAIRVITSIPGLSLCQTVKVRKSLVAFTSNKKTRLNLQAGFWIVEWTFPIPYRTISQFLVFTVHDSTTAEPS